jgi:sugar phosphate isomerase/epimerase
MRLGGPIFGAYDDPEAWVQAVQAEGYRAAYCPLEADASDDLVEAYAKAAREADIVIAEVDAWSNPLSSDEETCRAAFEHCRNQLYLADRIGALCCVNISGSRGEQWDGPDPANYTEETFDMIVESVRAIIDVVKPKRTFYTLETMPWMYPDSAESYHRLIEAIARPRFAVHFDPVNIVNSPERYYRNGELIQQFVQKLGPHIKACHAKDVLLSTRLTVHLDEVRPGLGSLDYRTYLCELSHLSPDLPLMLEHLETQEEYRSAAEYVRKVYSQLG